MRLFTILVGSFYITRSIFRFSENFTNYLFNQKIIELPITKIEKINDYYTEYILQFNEKFKNNKSYKINKTTRILKLPFFSNGKFLPIFLIPNIKPLLIC